VQKPNLNANVKNKIDEKLKKCQMPRHLAQWLSPSDFGVGDHGVQKIVKARVKKFLMPPIDSARSNFKFLAKIRFFRQNSIFGKIQFFDQISIFWAKIRFVGQN
jgi:hypothetical protein